MVSIFGVHLESVWDWIGFGLSMLLGLALVASCWDRRPGQGGPGT